MNRRQRKKAAAKLSPPPAKPAPPQRSREKIFFAPGGFVDKVARLVTFRRDLIRALAVSAVRSCSDAGSPGDDLLYFFACLGEAIALDSRVGPDLLLYERCEATLRGTVFYGHLREQVNKLDLTEEDRRILRQWKN